MIVRVEDLTGWVGPQDEWGDPANDDPPWADLSGDTAALRKLWGLILLLAVRDRAASVHYHPWRADGGLACVVGNVRYVMLPPPTDLGPAVVAAARSLIEPPRGPLARAVAARRGTVSGSFTLDVWGNPFEWDVVCWSSGPRCGAELYRVSPPPAVCPAEPMA